MATAAAGYSWADLNSELLVSIATADDNGLSLRDYVNLRGVCTAWRSALAPPYPCILSFADDRASSIFSLPMRRSYSMLDEKILVMDIGRSARVVGSANGRFAVAIDRRRLYDDIGRRVSCWTEVIFLHGPRTSEEVQLPPPGKQGSDYVRKIVFAPNPNDSTVVAMYDQKKVAYVDASSSSDDMKWTAVDVVSGNTEHLVDLVFDDTGGGKVYCLDSCGGVRVLSLPRGVRDKQDEPGPVAVEPSVTVLSLPGFAVLAPPYNIASAKHLFFCHGDLYQLWQNTSVTVRSRNGLTMSADEIFVLRYNPGRAPHCWDAVKDLGGCSVFVGKNSSPVSVQAGALPGVRADCVYWIDGQRVPMVCDLATGASKPYILHYYDTCTSNCWYFNDCKMTSVQPSTTTRGIKRRIDTSGDCGKKAGPTWTERPRRRRLVLD